VGRVIPAATEESESTRPAVPPTEPAQAPRERRLAPAARP